MTRLHHRVVNAGESAAVLLRSHAWLSRTICSMSESVRLILAGYVVAAPTARPPGLDQLLPSPYVTISSCLADDPNIPEFSGWFQDSAEAEAALDRLPAANVLAVGLAEPDAAIFAAEMADESRHFELLRRANEMPTAARQLGFEIIGAEYGLAFHSWHCHGLASDASAALGVRLNQYGLLDDHTDAARVLEWMQTLPDADSDAPAPVPWTAAAIATMGRGPFR